MVSLLALILSFAPFVLSCPAAERRAIDQSTFDDLVHYMKFASTAYRRPCDNPNGATLVSSINDLFTDTQGFIATDEDREEIVVVFRGSSSAIDFVTDSLIELVDFESPGVSPPDGTQVHTGFLRAWNAVADDVMSTLDSELAANPGFNVVTSGHSLGGALSSLAAISIQQNFPDVTVTMYTYGQPRTGNPAYADFVDDEMEGRVFRSVHTTDGVPTILPSSVGYAHHGVEFFQTEDPSSPDVIKQCELSDDPTCSDSIPSGGINAAHLSYYDIVIGTSFC